MEKYGRAGQATVGNMIWRMHFACWIPKARDTYSEYVILPFHGNNAYANAPHCCSIRTLPVLFINIILFTQMSGVIKSVMCGLRGYTIRGSSPGRVKNLIRSKSPRQRLGPTEPLIKWVPLF